MLQKGTIATPRLDLGAALEEYPLAAPGLIGTQALPIFSTPKREGQYNTVTRESILRTRNVNRGANGSYSRDSFDTDVLEYACKEYGHEQPLGDDQVQYYASAFDAEMTAASVARGVLLREQEKRVAALFQNVSSTGWYSSTAALYTNTDTDWDDITSLIVTDVDNAKEKVRINCGLPANTMIISAAVLPWLKKNTDIKARLQYTNAITSDVIAGMLPSLFGIPKVLIAGGVYDSANEGQTMSLADVWSDNYAWIGVTATTNSIAEPCVGRTFLWSDDSADNVTVEEYREEQTRSNIYRVRHHLVEKIQDLYFGHVLLIDT